jgi:hypothetical protein
MLSEAKPLLDCFILPNLGWIKLFLEIFKKKLAFVGLCGRVVQSNLEKIGKAGVRKGCDPLS